MCFDPWSGCVNVQVEVLTTCHYKYRGIQQKQCTQKFKELPIQMNVAWGWPSQFPCWAYLHAPREALYQQTPEKYNNSQWCGSNVAWNAGCIWLQIWPHTHPNTQLWHCHHTVPLPHTLPLYYANIYRLWPVKSVGGGEPWGQKYPHVKQP